MPPPQGTPNPIEGPADYTFTKQVHSDTYPAIAPTQWDLSGRTVFIAGASKGVGRECAAAYAAAGTSHIAIGARSSLADTNEHTRQAARDADRPPPQVMEIRLDVADPASCDAAAARIEKAFGGIDVLVVCAGVLGARGAIGPDSSDAGEWEAVVRTNLFGPYYVARACMGLVKRSTLQTVLVVASVGALLHSPGLSAYQIAKLGTVRMMEFLCSEEEGVVALSVHPGNMLTDIVGRGSKIAEALLPVFVDTPKLAADAIVFLTKERREWLRGRYVNCTWDLPELVGEAKKKEIIDGDKLKIKLVV